MALKLNHVHLKTTDPKRTAQWYVDNLGGYNRLRSWRQWLSAGPARARIECDHIHRQPET